MNDICFKLVKITVNQFAIIDNIYDYGKQHTLDATFSFAKDLTERSITVKIKFTFLFNKSAFMITEGSCQFGISEDGWQEMLQTTPYHFQSFLYIEKKLL